MKRIILIFFLSCFMNSIGQTFTIVVQSTSQCYPASFSWGLYGDSFSIGNESYNSNNGIASMTYTTVPNYNSFKLTFSPETCGTLFCVADDPVISPEFYASDLIKQGFSSSIGICSGDVYIYDFKPNLTLQKANASITEVCSGEMLDLEGFPASFPNVAYHWQYSLNNQATWVDVPAGFNDNPNSNFTMQDILGSSHVSYWDKTIHFRLGYQGRTFTDAIAVTYVPCAPIVKKITYLGPKCSGDSIQELKVTFNRNLLQGERLENFAVIKTNGTLTTIQVRLINTFEGTDPDNRFYSKTNFTGLENGKTYSVKYQAFQDAKPRGVIPTDSTFSYKEPAPLTFTTIPLNPLCSDGTAGITVTATGGTPPYSYILDNNGVKIPFTTPQPYTITGLTPVNHNIKVINANDCFEK